jgi:penicillin-insensitive murein endopeptidase
MGIWFTGISLFFVALTANAHSFHPTATPIPTPFPTNIWSRVENPTSGSALSIGYYSAGCISGASTLSLDGSGYQVMKVFRNRYYGHPTLLDFIRRMGASLNAVGSAILIGDMSQPRGGPLPYGHASHQIGLDVDIWYWTDPDQLVRSLSEDERNSIDMKTVLTAKGKVDPTKFTAETILKLKTAATDPVVERIFVNPAIKTYLCKTLPASEHSWLHTLRPWTGHDDHFHVRIQCSSDSPNCTPQVPETGGDGCSARELSGASLDLQVSTNGKESPKMAPEIEKLLQDAKDTLPSMCMKVLKQL